MSHTRQTGFTLIEVLVALAIVALALGSGMAAMSSLTRSTLRQTHLLLAQLCADNALVQMRLSRHMPGTGSSNHGCEQAGMRFDVAVLTSPTPNPSFRRVQAQVSLDDQPVLQVSTVVGKY